MTETYRFVAPLWQYPGPAAWHFVTLPAEVAADIEAIGGLHRGFRSVRVRVTVGGTTWRTSIFPDRERGYVLPVKRTVRAAERLQVDEPVRGRIELLDPTTPVAPEAGS